MRLNHDPMPSEHLQKKIDYYTINHNYEQKTGKSMQETHDAIFLGDPEKRTGWEHLHEFITSRTQTQDKRQKVYNLLWKKRGDNIDEMVRKVLNKPKKKK